MEGYFWWSQGQLAPLTALGFAIGLNLSPALVIFDKERMRMKKRERTSLRENDTFCFNIIQFELRIEMGLGLALLMCNFIIKKKKREPTTSSRKCHIIVPLEIWTK